jgi:hypothetical protein
MLLDVGDEALPGPLKIEIVYDRCAEIADDISVELLGAEILCIEFIEIWVRLAIGEERTTIADDGAGTDAVVENFLLVEITRELEVKGFPDVVLGLEGDGRGVIVENAARAGGVKLFAHDGRIVMPTPEPVLMTRPWARKWLPLAGR